MPSAFRKSRKVGCPPFKCTTDLNPRRAMSPVFSVLHIQGVCHSTGRDDSRWRTATAVAYFIAVKKRPAGAASRLNQQDVCSGIGHMFITMVHHEMNLILFCQ